MSLRCKLLLHIHLKKYYGSHKHHTLCPVVDTIPIYFVLFTIKAFLDSIFISSIFLKRYSPVCLLSWLNSQKPKLNRVNMIVAEFSSKHQTSLNNNFILLFITVIIIGSVSLEMPIKRPQKSYNSLNSINSKYLGDSWKHSRNYKKKRFSVNELKIFNHWQIFSVKKFQE